LSKSREEEKSENECESELSYRAVGSMEKAPLTTVAGTVAVADPVLFKKDKQFCSCTLFSKQNIRARTLLGMGRS